MPRTLVVGDIHGANKALVQCLERCNFQEDDTLIQLGDVADGWSEVPAVVETLLGIKNLIAIRGNHDDWAIQWMKFGVPPNMWLKQGGQATYNAYQDEKLRSRHLRDFFDKQAFYYVDEQNRAFVHGGYVNHDGLGNDRQSTYMWDRELWTIAMSGKSGFRALFKDQRLPRRLRAHKEIYIGHTTTMGWDESVPMNACNVWNMDTGAGFNGRLSIMDVDNKEFWLSNSVQDLYPEEKGRHDPNRKKRR